MAAVKSRAQLFQRPFVNRTLSTLGKEKDTAKWSVQKSRNQSSCWSDGTATDRKNQTRASVRKAKKTLPTRVVRGREEVRIPATAITFNGSAQKRQYTSLATPPIHTVPVRCHHCLAAGHMHKYCPLRYCRLCDMYSHTAKQCFRNTTPASLGSKTAVPEATKFGKGSSGATGLKWRVKPGNTPVPYNTVCIV